MSNPSLAAQLDKLLKKMTSKSLLLEVGDFVVDMIKDRVQGRGQGVRAAGSPTSKLKPLSKGWIMQRANSPRLSSETTPSTSNLTYTGQMLDGLYATFKNGKLIVTVKSGAALEKATYTNETRPWVNVSKGEATKIRAFVERLIKKNL